jgi:hypothetical protein
MRQSIKISNPNDERSRKLLRVDRLARQLAEAEGTSCWGSAITKRSIEFGSPPDAARQLAAELNWAAASGRNSWRFGGLGGLL